MKRARVERLGVRVTITMSEKEFGGLVGALSALRINARVEDEDRRLAGNIMSRLDIANHQEFERTRYE